MTRLLMLLVTFTFAMPATAETCDKPQAIGDGWSIAAPDDLGLDGAQLCRLDNFLAQWPHANIHAGVIVRRGKLVIERYATGEDSRWVRSAAFTPFRPTPNN